MVTKTSTALIAAIFTIAGSAGMSFAQATNETTPPPSPAEAAADAAAQAADAAKDAAAAAGETANEAATAAGNAAGEAAGAAAEAAADAANTAADAAETAADAAAESATGTTPATPAAPAATDAPAAAASSEASAAPAPAAPADGEPKVGQSYVKESFGDWQMRCIKTQDNKDPCELYQLLKDAQGGAVAEASLVPVTGEVAAIVTYVAPLETDLQQGLRLKIDNNPEQGYPFMVCAQIGCISRVGLTAADLNSYKRGNSGSISLHPFGAPKEQSVKLTLSLKGFTAGVDAVQKAMAELDGAAPAVGTATPAPAAPAAPAAAAPAPAAPAAQ